MYHVITDHTHYVQGVSWDPSGQFVATQSSDRSVNIYPYTKKNNKIIFSSPKKFTKLEKSQESTFRLYHDENLVSFFRRLSFSPDGGLLITPAGLNKTDTSSEEEDLQNCAYVYARNMLQSGKQPIGLIGNYPKPSIAIRWCTTLFKKRSNFPSAFALPYRMLYASATQDSVYIYDTQQTRPICAISGMHFAPITDLAWSHDGSILMFSSADGYCSTIVFSDQELGIKHEKQVERVSEQDVEMMDIAPKKRVEPPVKNLDMTKKRRIAPTLISTLMDGKKQENKKRITPVLISSHKG